MKPIKCKLYLNNFIANMNSIEWNKFQGIDA